TCSTSSRKRRSVCSSTCARAFSAYARRDRGTAARGPARGIPPRQGGPSPGRLTRVALGALGEGFELRHVPPLDGLGERRRARWREAGRLATFRRPVFPGSILSRRVIAPRRCPAVGAGGGLGRVVRIGGSGRRSRLGRRRRIACAASRRGFALPSAPARAAPRA